MSDTASVQFSEREALLFHSEGRPGKIEIIASKPMATQRDLALAYSPGVAVPVQAIADDPATAYDYTAKGNLVAVISNGTAILGMGNLGALASKPVMEGKAVLFKRFADVDSIDIELKTEDVDRIIDAIELMEPSFGGINLEDIKAPDCFYIEQQLRKRMKIPVFHDDQHGTAIIVAAGILNGLELVGKEIGNVKVAVSGAGAASIACLDLLVSLGLNKSLLKVCDSQGVIYPGRDANMEENKARYANDTSDRDLAEAMVGADIFIGVSKGGVVSAQMVESMAAKPLIFALANPHPEIAPEKVHAVRDDAIVATGRSDYPNQINNVLCFPYIFRGALDVGATTINEEMKLACVRAIAALAKEPLPGHESSALTPLQLIPSPFDERLRSWVAPAVSQAAIATGVATRALAK